MAARAIADRTLSIWLKIIVIFYRQLQNARGHPTVPALIPMINRRHPLIMQTRVRLAAVDGLRGSWCTGFIPWFFSERVSAMVHLPLGFASQDGPLTGRQYV